MLIPQMFASLMAPKLGEYRRLTAAAILRSHQSPLVPADYDAEPVGGKFMYGLEWVALWD